MDTDSYTAVEALHIQDRLLATAAEDSCTVAEDLRTDSRTAAEDLAGIWVAVAAGRRTALPVRKRREEHKGVSNSAHAVETLSSEIGNVDSVRERKFVTVDLAMLASLHAAIWSGSPGDSATEAGHFWR